MKKIFFSIVLLSQIIGATQNPCFEQTAFGLSKSIENTVNCIRGKVCAIQNNNIDSCCEVLSNQIDSCCESLSSQIDSIQTSTSPCEPTPITSATTISDSGNYCMANDISGTIAIEANGAIFDMNGHTLTASSGNALSITGNNVEVFDGRLVGTGGGVDGISVAGSNGFRLRDLEIFDFTVNGIEIDSDANGGFIEYCDIVSCGTGIQYIDCNNMITKNVTIVGPSGGSGFSLNPSSDDVFNFEFDSCLARDCTDGFIQPSIAEIIGIIIRNCQSNSNSNNGFDLQFYNGLLIENCVASLNLNTGFDLTSRPARTSRGTVKGCVAVGTVDTRGFTALSTGGSTETLFISNQAYGHSGTGIGFEITNIGSRAYNNYAGGNGTDYSGVSPTLLSASVTTDTGWWTNVERT